MTGPREWRHASSCQNDRWRRARQRAVNAYLPHGEPEPPCDCGLSAVRDAIAAGHRVVIRPDGVVGRLIETWLAGDYEIVPLEGP